MTHFLDEHPCVSKSLTLDEKMDVKHCISEITHIPNSLNFGELYGV